MLPKIAFANVGRCAALFFLVTKSKIKLIMTVKFYFNMKKFIHKVSMFFLIVIAFAYQCISYQEIEKMSYKSLIRDTICAVALGFIVLATKEEQK